jgi:hypothetical protein
MKVDISVSFEGNPGDKHTISLDDKKIAKVTVPFSVPIPVVAELPDHWIINRNTIIHKGQLICQDRAVRLDGVSVGKNGSWCASGKGHLEDIHPKRHFVSSSMEECCLKVDRYIPYVKPNFPRLAWWHDPNDNTKLMKYMLVYDIEKVEDGLYSIDGVCRTHEPYWGEDPDSKWGNKTWLPHFPKWGERKLYAGTFDNIFTDEQAKIQARDREDGWACGTPIGTFDILFPRKRETQIIK